jgi:hypothetical protein
MNTLESFVANFAPDAEILVAYVELVSTEKLATIAHELSQVCQAKFVAGLDFDECEAFVAPIRDHEMTILQSPEDVAAGRFEIRIEPGHYCQGEGEAVDLSTELSWWLTMKAASVGRFGPMV